MESDGIPGSPDGIDVSDSDKEFQQFFVKGVTFYRHVPKNQDSEHTSGEMNIHQTSDDAKHQLKTNDVLPFDENKINCPYCIKLIEKAKQLFIDKPSDKQQEIAGVCSHCRRKLAMMKEPFHLSTTSAKGLGALHYLKSRMSEADKKERKRKGEHLKKGQISSRTLKRPLQSIQESDDEQGKKRKTKGKRHEEKDEEDYDKEERLKSKSKEQQESGREIDEKSKGPLKSKDDILAAMKDGKQSKSKSSLKSEDDILAAMKGGKQSKSKGSLAAEDDKEGRLKSKSKEQQESGREIDEKSKGPLKSKDDILAAMKDGKQSKSKSSLKSEDDTLAAMKDGKRSKSKGILMFKDNISDAKKDGKKSKSKGPATAKDDISMVEVGETLLRKDEKTGKSKEEAKKSKVKSPSTALLLAQIAQERLKKQEDEIRKKEQERLKKESELAEKRAKEAEERLKHLNSIDRSTSRIVSTDSGASIVKQRATHIEPLVYDIIRGQKIYKVTRKRANEDIGVDETGKSPMNKLKTTDRASAVKSKGLKQELNPQKQENRTNGTNAGSEKLRNGGDGTKHNHNKASGKPGKEGGDGTKQTHNKGSGKPEKEGEDETKQTHNKGSGKPGKEGEDGTKHNQNKGSGKPGKEGGDGTQPHIKGSIEKTGKANKTRVGKSGRAAEDTETTNTEDGVIRFSLSDPTFIDKGWTMLPLEKVVRKMNVYRMRPANPKFDWFERNKGKLLQYSSGEKLAELDSKGRGEVYYRKGDLALQYYNAEETNAGRRIVVYSTGNPDENGRPRPKTVLATFDHTGSGIVYDHSGKTRLKYNQTEGAVLDQKLGAVGNWKWHTLNDPPLLQQVMIETQLEHKIQKISKMDGHEHPKKDDEAMLAIEIDNVIKEKKKKVQQAYQPFHIKMKVIKINENFSLKVVDQKTIYLLYRDGTTNVKINIGMKLDTQEILDTDISEIGDVSNKMDVLPACTASIAELQKQVAKARAGEDRRAARARAWHLPKESVDVLYSGISRPLRTPVVACNVCASKPSKASCGCCNSIS